MTTTREITEQETEKLLANAVADRGEDFVYPEEWKYGADCQYFLPDGKPACIVGHVLDQLGLTQTNISSVGVYGQLFPAVQINEHLAHTGIAFTKDAVDLLVFVQNRQDRGVPWGDAVDTSLEPI